MRPGNYPTQADKLKDIKETQNVDRAIIKHYIWIQKDFRSIIQGYDDDIATIQAEKEKIIDDFHNAPARIKEAQKHLDEMITKYQTLRYTATNVKQKKKRLAWLRERAAILQQELEDDGIDINNVELESRTLDENNTK